MTTSPRANVAQMLWDTAARFPERPAILHGATRATYRQLRARAAAIAVQLKASGVAPGDRVGVFVDGGVDGVATFFAILACGAVAVVINEALRPRQIEYMLTHAEAKALLTTAELLARQPRAIRAPAAVLELAQIPTGGPAIDPVPVGEDALAQITYTSGSTGAPKGVMISHANLWAAMRTVTRYLGIEPFDRIASILPFSFVYGMSQVLCAVGTGAALIVERSPLANQLVANLRAREVTVLAAVPPLWGQLLGVAGFRDASFPTLRVLTNAGGHLPVERVRALRQAQPQARLFLMYGLTEVLRSTYLPPDQVDARPGSMGKAIPEADVLVLREDLTECAPGETGELVHAGPTVTLGYWHDPANTARTFRPHPVRPQEARRVVFSGDLVRRDADGFLFYVGRRDRLIKSLGYRVSPEEVAEVIQGSGEVVEVVVTGEADPQRGEQIVAHVVLRAEDALERLRRFCGIELPRYMQPARYEVHASLPRLPSGKFDLLALRGAPRDVLQRHHSGTQRQPAV